MKNKLLNLCSLVALGGLLVCPASHLQAQTITNTYIQTFDAGGNTTPFAGGSTAGWFMWYNFFGNVTMTNDPSMDADGTPGSGSLLVSLPFTSAGGQQVFYGSFDNQYQYDTAQTANATLFTNITFKVRVQAGTPPDANGNFGSIGVGLLTDFGNGGEPGVFSSQTIPGAASNGWVTITAPIDKTATGVNQVGGFFFNYNNFGGFPHAPIVFWMDDVAMNFAGAPPPPPTLSVAKPVQGLNVFAGSGGVNDRESVMSTTSSGLSWIGAGGPVTYSFTIASYPDSATYSGFASYMFLIPGPFTAEGNQAAPYQNIPSFETAPDYNETNVVFLDIENQNYNVTNNSVVSTIHGAVAQLRYKVSEPSGNNMIYGNPPYTNAAGSGSANFGSGTLGSVSCPTAVGTWSLTFNGNTSATVTGPDGTHATFTIPSADAAVFSDAGGFAYLIGCQPNTPGAIGQEVVFSSVSVTGVSSPISKNFLADSTLDTNTWVKLAASAPSVFVVPSGSAYWVNWTLPDAGYSLQTATALGGGSASWLDAGLTPVGPIAGTRKALVSSANVAGSSTGFYRMVQRTFTQLQVLLPGETNAPDTVTGKTGTPTSATPGQDITVTINAVDANFHIIGGVGDTVALTADDGTAFLPNPTAMANGTLQEVVNLDTDGSNPGTHHVTATDQSNAAILPNTSSGVLVQ